MDQFSTPDNARKAADRAAPILAAYTARYGPEEPVDAMIADLITDLLHLADRTYRDGIGGRDGNAVLDRACSDYGGET